MGRIVGSFAAATIAGSIAAVLAGATLLMMCGAGPALAGPAAMIARENTTPITASDAVKACTMPPAPWRDPNVKYSGPSPGADFTGSAAPPPTATPTPVVFPQVSIAGVRTDRVPTPGHLLFDKTR